jgi:hypothetical protein
MQKDFSKNIKKFGLLVAGSILVIYAVIFIPVEESYFGVILEIPSDPKWDEISPRYIVKNSIPITLMEKDGQNCLLDASNLDKIINHAYFVKGEEIASNLNYNSKDHTIMIPCEVLHGEKSRLEIWYVTEDSPNHAAKYQYFITPWNDTKSD